MTLQAILFGSIGTIAETSDVQRRAFNAAFADAGLDWNWDADTYRGLLTINGGQARIRAYCDQIGVAMLTHDVVTAIHAGKTAHYADMLATNGLEPRTGVAELIAASRAAHVRVALCTSTSRDNVDAMATALRGRINFADFAIVTSLDDGIGVKPLPDAFRYALVQLGLDAAKCVAIEDSPVSIAAAKAAGLFTIATPGQFVRDQDFGAADRVCDDLSGVSLDEIVAYIAA